MATGDKRNTAMLDIMAPDVLLAGITTIGRATATMPPDRGIRGLFGSTNRGVSLFATSSAPEGAIGVGVPWKPVMLPTCPHPKVATGGPVLKFPLLLASPTRGRAPTPKPGISYTFDFGTIAMGAQ